MPNKSSFLEARAVTTGPLHHFFGYYDKLQWDATGRYLLSLETSFIDRSPKPTDLITIGMIDLESENEFHPLAQTRAWCWQQGTMLQWIPTVSETQIIYNDRISDRFVSIILDVKTKEKRTLPRPIYTISNDGKSALSLNFSRNAITRPGYGYNGLKDHFEDELHPADDGVYLMDLETGNHELIVSIDSVANYEPDETMSGAKHWVNHILFGPDDKRFFFLHRWKRQEGGFFTRAYTANPDGSELYLLPIEHGSHFIWYDNNRILIWAHTKEHGSKYYICTDQTDEVEVMGEGILPRNGHCTVSPDGRWILTDEYPDSDNKRPLILYNPFSETRIDIGSFFSPPELTGELRCDLHPRWSRDGNYVCIDSVHEISTIGKPSRQMYVLKVSSIVAK